MPYSTIYVHLVWCTKYRDPILSSELKEVLLPYIRNTGKKHKIYIDAMDGHLDHIHCLVSMTRTQSISHIAKILKGESSRWLMDIHPYYEGTIWQPGYWAASVGPERLNQVRQYIRNQEEHHKKRNLENEVEKMHSFPEETLPPASD